MLTTNYQDITTVKPISKHGEPVVFFDLEKNPLYSERRTELVNNTAYYECQFDDIYIRYDTLDLLQSTRIRIQGEQPFVQLKFNLTQDSCTYMDEKRILTLPQKHHSLLYINKNNACYQELEAGQQEVFSINLSPAFFLHYCPQVEASFLSFRKHVQENMATACALHGLPTTPAMRQIIHDILHYSHSPQFTHVYLKAKVIELLMLQLEQHNDCHTHLLNGRLKKEELQRMWQVKQMIEEQYNKEHTLVSLAREVGTNDSTLKKHFKIAFGCTVFSYLTSIRMQRAKDMLHEKNAKIAHIANHIGYKYSSHFSAAFKKHFGYLPTAFK